MKIFWAMLRDGVFSPPGAGGSGQRPFHGVRERVLEVKTSSRARTMMLKPGRQRDAQWNILLMDEYTRQKTAASQSVLGKPAGVVDDLHGF